MALIKQAYRPNTDTDSYFVNKSIKRQKQYKARYNELLNKYNTLCEDTTSDIDEITGTLERMNTGINLIGKCHDLEILEGFKLDAEIKAIELNLDNITVAEEQIKSITGDMWQLRKYDAYIKHNKAVAVFERPYYFNYSNVIDD